MASGGCDPEEGIGDVHCEIRSTDIGSPHESKAPESSKSDDLSASEITTEENKKPSGSATTFFDAMSMFLMNELSRSIFASLVNDFVESEFFVIDGDSLLITHATNCTLSHGQSLHFAFLVECFLLNLMNKGARYVVVFFEDMKETYRHYRNLMSLRTQLILHLQKNTNTVVHIFSNFLSEEWKEFVREQPPYFLMVSDEGLSQQQTYFYEMLILNALGSQIDVVLMSGQESDNLRVYGYHVKSAAIHKRYLQCHAEHFIVALEKVCNLHKKHEKPNQKFQEMVEKCIILLSTSPNETPDIRAITCAVSCSLILGKHAQLNNSDNVQDDTKHLTLEEAADLCKIQCLCMAVRMILPLSQRARLRRINAKWSKSVHTFLHMNDVSENIVLDHIRDHTKKKEINWTHVLDLNDDLLLKNIAYFFEREHFADFKLEFGKEINKMYKYLWETTLKLVSQDKNLPSYPIRTTSKAFLSPKSTVNVEQKEILHVGLIPMKSDVIEEYAKDTIKELPMLSSDDPIIPSLAMTKSYDELLHWHSGRPLSDDYDRTKNNNEKVRDKWSMKAYQKLQSFNHRYGESLGIKSSKKIVLQTDQSEETNASRASGKRKEPQMKKKDQIIEENLKKKKEKGESKEKEQWKILESSLEKEIRDDFFSGIKKIETVLKSLHTSVVKYSAQLRALEISFEIWQKECRIKSKDQRDINIVVEIIKIIQAIMNNHQDLILKEDQKRIASYLSKLGFKNLACTLMPPELPSAKEEEKESSYAVGVGSVHFQMQYMGPYLIRDERKDPDPRVQHFIPDTWQRELLDVVDNNESAVIVAPTSSGKTYASYYCMEKVLTQSNEGVVVYVAPTKALVNQVVATVSSMFNKDLPDGLVLCGVFTRDYRTDALNCQVLVTVPQCLEILLICPHRQDWVKRIKYIIFDEIHCLGGEIGAEIWEHILAMIRCPFLALSATISNPKHLTEWLQSIRQYWQRKDDEGTNHVLKLPQKGKKKSVKKEKRSYKVRLVQYDKRYNDLETYMCSAQDSNINFEHLHPCAALTINHMQNYGMPQDLSLSPRESIQLYDTMVTAWPMWPNLKTCNPEESIHLKDKIIIRKNDTAKYEDDLKTELLYWVHNGHADKVSEVLKSLSPSEQSDEEDPHKCFPLIVEKLEKINKLPALFFAFEINLVEDLALTLGLHLQEKLENKQTEKMEREIQKLQQRAEKLEKSIKAGFSESMTSEEKRTSGKNEAMVIKKANYESILNKIKKLTEIPPDCTYADDKAVDKETVEKIYQQSRRSRNIQELIYLSEKGIGFHHGAVDGKGRKLVEMLFRMGYIRVVTSTSSLALGINMPCKSVVFMKDSVYLDALNYRQMSGRAGRRGQDLLGSVYFFNISMAKVKKLMKSNVPQLRGQFPLSITFILRLMLLASKADDKEDAKAKVISTLKHSLMSFKQPVETQMLKLYFVFSLQLLLYLGYLDQDCNTTAFTGLVTHLYYHEPSNLVFTIFLEKGLFHQLCKPCSEDPTKFPVSVMEALVLVLANIFGRHYLPPKRLKTKNTFFQSKVFLDELPDDFAAAVNEYNNKVKSVFGRFVLTVSKFADMKKEHQLPLSNINFSGVECLDSGLVNHLMSCSEGRSAISPFACLSGNTDHDLMTVTNVSSLMLQTAHIPDKYIPLLHLESTDACGRKRPLNSYALDFFKHGSMEAIQKDNRFNAGDAYNKLKDFSLTISSISTSLKELCEDEHDPVTMAFEQLKSIYSQLLA